MHKYKKKNRKKNTPTPISCPYKPIMTNVLYQFQKLSEEIHVAADWFNAPTQNVNNKSNFIEVVAPLEHPITHDCLKLACLVYYLS